MTVNDASNGDLPPVASQIRALSCDKSTRRANHFWFPEIVSSPKIKNISLPPSGKSVALVPPSRAHKRGASRSSRTLGAGCDGRLGVRRKFFAGRERQGVRPSRVVLTPRCWHQA